MNRHGTGGTVELGVETVSWQRSELCLPVWESWFDFSDASGNLGCSLNCSCECVWLGQMVSHWKRPELCRKWKLSWTAFFKRNGKLCCEFVFHVFDRSLNSFAVSQAGQVWLTFFGLLQSVVKPDTDVEKVHWTLRQVGTLELLSDWLDFMWRQLECKYSPFWLRAIIPYLSRWMGEHGDICKPVWLWDELYGLYSNDCQCGLPTLVMALHLVEM